MQKDSEFPAEKRLLNTLLNLKSLMMKMFHLKVLRTYE